ncbi:5-oxoprolinase [Malassezia pachydermatis]
MALADRVYELQEPSNETWAMSSTLDETTSHGRIQARVDELTKRVTDELLHQGFARERVHTDIYLHMRYEGTDTALMTLKPADSWDMEKVFVETYRQEFGFVLAGRPILVDDIRIRGIGRTFDSLGPSVLAEYTMQSQKGADAFPEAKALAEAPRRPVYFDGMGRVPTAIVRLRDLDVFEHVPGPAILIDETQTILVEPRCKAHMLSQAVIIHIEY